MLNKVLKMHWKCTENMLKMHWKCAENTLKMCWKCTKNALIMCCKCTVNAENVLKTHWKPAENVLSCGWRYVKYLHLLEILTRWYDIVLHVLSFFFIYCNSFLNANTSISLTFYLDVFFVSSDFLISSLYLCFHL